MPGPGTQSPKSAQSKAWTDWLLSKLWADFSVNGYEVEHDIEMNSQNSNFFFTFFTHTMLSLRQFNVGGKCHIAMFSGGGTVLLPAVKSMIELKNHHFGKVVRSIHLVFNVVVRNDWAPILGWKKENTKCAQVLEAFTIFIVFPLTPPFIDDCPIKTTIHRGCSY